jgi:hypothetical protein
VTTLCSARMLERGSLIRTAATAFFASVFALFIGGCGSSSNLLGGGSTPGAEASLTQPGSSSAVVQSAKLQIAPVIGSPENVARDLQSHLASSIGRSGITVATSPETKSDYVVRGYIVAAREKTKAKISYIWDVTDQSGKRVHRITGEEVAEGAGKDPWSAVTPQVVQSIADKTATQIASWLPGAGGIPVASNTPVTATPPASTASTESGASTKTADAAASTASPPVAPTTGSIATSGPIMAIVPTVTGAPGDGGDALTAAIQRELTKNGVTLASAPGTHAYKVEGKVAMGESKDGKQPIQIDWNVLDPAGKKLGTVSQKNEVPQGSLDGAWGKTADAAAAAAAQGIIKLLPAKSTN